MTGVRIINRLPEFLEEKERAAARAVLSGVIMGSNEAASMTPVDTSNLINSQYRHISKDGTKIIGRAGYTAAYAKYVHEASGKLRGQSRSNGHGVYWGPNDGQPQFLKKGFERQKANIDAAIKKEMKP